MPSENLINEKTFNMLERLFDIGLLLVGITLGWLINKLEEWRKLRLNIINYSLSFDLYTISKSGENVREPKNYNESTHIDFVAHILFYNKSSLTKIVCKPVLEFYNKRKLLDTYTFREEVKDGSGARKTNFYFNFSQKEMTHKILKVSTINKTLS